MGYPETFTGYRVHSSDTWSEFHKESWTPKKFTEYDIDIKIECCGVCGSDVHTLTAGWGSTPYPLAVGHEIIGKAIRVGDKVTSVKVGDRVGVGAQIWACGKCKLCKNDFENYCPHRKDTYGDEHPDGGITQGGYSSHVRAHEQFTFPIPPELPSSIAGPMLCGGLTTYSPLKAAGVGPGSKVAIIGMGGLGHFAVLFSVALGAETWVVSHSPHKKDDALKMGAKGFILTDKPGWNEDYKFEFDVVLCAANFGVDLPNYLVLNKPNGKMINVGLPEEPFTIKPFDMMNNGAGLSVTHIGSKKECLEMLELAAKQNVKSWVEEIDISEAGCKEAVERVRNNKVKYRFTLTGYDKVFGKGDHDTEA
ncbi:NADP-dependent alcohol dehydrogenase 6 [Atractiella rhizophila]|nr:NADP-dependent alcohol dehydrogenase 6 [Atractiella rhizophila]KAH8916491.1 NADP-dependent alcohol dehydrogenase 6 [Atractiella rhizophila]